MAESLSKADGPVKARTMKFIDNALEEVFADMPQDAVNAIKNAQAQYPRYKVLTSAARKEDFSPRQLAESSFTDAGNRVGARGGGMLQREAQDAVDAIKDPTKDPGLWRRLASVGFASGAAGFMGGPVGGIVTALTIYGGSRIAATKLVQNALMGQGRAQKLIQNLVAKNPGLSAEIERQMVAQGGAQLGQTAQE